MGRSSEPYRPSKMGLAASDSELRLARYALQMSEHLTEGSESSFWPTAQARDWKGPPGVNVNRSNLAREAALWPTPRASDGTKGGPGQRGSKGDLMLPSLVLWPTPSAVSYGSNKGGAAGRVGETRHSLESLAAQSGRLGGTPPRGRSTVALNPEFVETLMGLPVGWTDCGYSETESSRSKPQSPSSSASRGS